MHLLVNVLGLFLGLRSGQLRAPLREAGQLCEFQPVLTLDDAFDAKTSVQLALNGQLQIAVPIIMGVTVVVIANIRKEGIAATATARVVVVVEILSDHLDT